MFDAQIIKTGGDDVVVLSRRDYEVLLARAGEPAAEDAVTARILGETKGKVALPAEVMDRILDGINPMRVLMDHRGLTQAEVARKAEFSQPFISKLTRGEVKASRQSIRTLAHVFGVSEDVLEAIG